MHHIMMTTSGMHQEEEYAFEASKSALYIAICHGVSNNKLATAGPFLQQQRRRMEAAIDTTPPTAMFVFVPSAKHKLNTQPPLSTDC